MSATIATDNENSAPILDEEQSDIEPEEDGTDIACCYDGRAGHHSADVHR